MATDRLINSTQGDSIITALNGISAKIQQVNQVDTALSTTSTNPVQNKVITSQLSKDRAALAELIDGAAKNRLTFRDLAMIKQMNTGGTWDGNVYTNRGVTFTINDDFSVTVSGTATGGNGVLVLSPRGGFSIEEGEWVLSGCPSGGSTATYNISIANTTSDTGRAAEFTSVSAKLVRIYILDGTTVDDLVFRPMVCSKAAWDISQTYKPYRPSYAELYEMVKALQGGASLNSVQSTAQPASISAGDNNADS